MSGTASPTCQHCGRTRQTQALRGGGTLHVCTRCDRSPCPECGLPLPPAAVNCGDCGALSAAHTPTPTTSTGDPT